jgi:hypothetical protein
VQTARAGVLLEVGALQAGAVSQAGPRDECGVDVQTARAGGARAWGRMHMIQLSASGYTVEVLDSMRLIEILDRNVRLALGHHNQLSQ